MRRWFLATFAAASLMFAAVPARADLSIFLPSATIADNTQSYIDVIISSTDMTSQQLYNAGYSFSISSVGTSGTRSLEFIKIQSEDFENDMGYVFSQHSYDANNPGPPGNIMVEDSDMNHHNDLLSGGDFNNDGVNSTVPLSPAGALLIRLQFTSFTTSDTPTVQDQFSIQLNPMTGMGTAASTTSFQSLDQFNSTNDGNDMAMIYTSNVATITVGGAVPEPGSFALLAIGGLTGGWMLRRRAARMSSQN